jgi:predicted outer membrane protein
MFAVHRIVAITVFAALAAGCSSASFRPPAPGGPLSADDVKLLRSVLRAGLWEGPISATVARRTKDPRVRVIGEQLASDHERLDTMTIALAAKLGVGLPREATPQQQSWVGKIAGLHGAAADHEYIDIVRAAHGTIFQLISLVRAETQNNYIRSFAQTANEVVMRHMTLLEGSEMADHTMLVANPIATNRANQRPIGSADVLRAVALGLLALVVTLLGLRRWGRRETKKLADEL